jgi:hypothetical protein
MKTYTIDEQNNITAFGSQEEAATGLAFTSQKELAKLTAEWPISRFVEIWNGFAGVAPFGELKPVKRFTDRKVAVGRIWQAIQRLSVDNAASAAEQETEPEAATEVPEPTEVAPEPLGEEVPQETTPAAPEGQAEPASVAESAVATEGPGVAQQVADVAPEVPAATAEASTVENAPAVAEPAATEQPAAKQPKRKKAPKPAAEPAAPRESKTAQVVAMLQRPQGATIGEIMQRMGWLKHTVRGFMAGTMKKAGYAVESFMPEGGERSYRIPSK